MIAALALAVALMVVGATSVGVDHASVDPATAAASTSDGLFAEGKALSAGGHHAEAAAKFLLAAQTDPARVDALLRAGLSLRRAGQLDDALVAYGRAVAHARATPELRLDGTYGLAETHRQRGDIDDAIVHFRRYLEAETRPEEARFVERARAALTELEARQRAASPVAPSPSPSSSSPSSSPSSSSPSPSPSPSSPVLPAEFFGDAVVVDGLLLEAATSRAAGDEARTTRLIELARALAPDDARLAMTAPAPCDAGRLLGRAEAALMRGDGPRAGLAFQQALACDPTRTAPLWGLSRVADLVGDRVAGRRHARRYLEARGPDQDPATARAAFFRSEQP